MRRIAALLSDRRGGSGFVQALILVVFLALAGLGAMRALGGQVEESTDCVGATIAALTSGGTPCAEIATGGATFPGADPTGQGGNGQGGTGGAGNAGGDNGGAGNAGDNGGAGNAGDNGGGGNTGNDNGGGDNVRGDNGGAGNAGDNGNAGEGGQQGQQPGGQPKADDPSNKVGGQGSVAQRNNGRQTNRETTRGGARPRTAQEEADANKKNTTTTGVEIGAEKKFLDAKGALGEKKFAGGSETLSGGFGKAEGVGFAKASAKDGASAGGKIEGKVSAVNLQGKHTIPGGIEESHEVDVLSVKGSLEGKAGVSKDVIGATVSGEAGANIAEAQVGAKKVLKIPFTFFGLEVGANASASVGANVGGEATAGYFKGEDGKRRVGFKGGFKAALGLGLGGKLSLNLVF